QACLKQERRREVQDRQRKGPQKEDGRKPVGQLHFVRMNPSDKRATFPETIDLSEKPEEVGSSFVINVGIVDQGRSKPGLFHADTQLDVFRIPVEGETARVLKNRPRHAHVETARLKPPDSSF